MRLLGRSARVEPLDAVTTADDVLQLGDASLPGKAEQLLGTKGRRFGRKKTTTGRKNEDSVEQIKTEEEDDFGSRLRTQEALLKTMPDQIVRRGGLRAWPAVQSYSANDLTKPNQRPVAASPTVRRGPMAPPGTASTATSQHVHREPSDSTIRSHYDPLRAPSYISQQTSASAVRDMALRKGSPMIHDITSDPTLATQQRPLKSAMKQQSVQSKPRSSDGTKKPRKLDLSHLWPQPSRNANQKVLSPNRLTHSPSALTSASDFFPQDTVHAQVQRSGPNARFETKMTAKPPSASSSSTTRPKIFEADIFDNAKTNVRRPPKGIQNWFDGFIISSDEDTEEEVKPQPVELPAETFPSIFSPFGEEMTKPTASRRKASIDPVEDNLLAIEHARQRIAQRAAGVRRGSGASVTVESVASPSASAKTTPSRKLGGESRLATSRLASQSVLSLSESSEDEKIVLPPIRDSLGDRSEAATPDVFLGGATSVGVQRPISPPRKLHTKKSFLGPGRESCSTVQTSGSIPITIDHDVPLPTVKRDTHTSKSDPTAKKDPTTVALRKLEGIRDSRSTKSRPASAKPSEYDGSTGGETLASIPTDAAHMMVVTEEEMALLEMMRSKRQAMQKNSFTEGYRLALKQEQESLALRRQSAKQTALNLLRDKQEKAKSKRSSRIESLPEDEAEQRKRFSGIRREEVDKTLKLDRFLGGMTTPTAESFPSPPVRGSEGAVSPLEEMLLPQTTYFPLMPTALRKQKERTEPVVPEEISISDAMSHFDMANFLTSSSASESAFPTPQKQSKSTDWERRRSKRMSTPSSPPIAEEEPVPRIPERSRNRILSPEPGSTAPTPDAEQKQRRRPSFLTDSDSLLETAMAFPAAPKTNHDYNPYHLSPNLDFQPLEFPISQIESPSLSTSRASPLTPSFTTAGAPSENMDVRVAGSDNASMRRAYTPDTDLSLGSFSNLALNTAKKASRKKPPALDTLMTEERVGRPGSINSITSAGADVLAAWADLGGGNDAYKARRKMAH